MAAAATTNGAGGRAGLGWVILVAALAVPGVLFYNWWSHLKAERERSVAAKARGRVPEGGVFQQPPASTKLVNPMDAGAAPSTSTVAAPMSAAAGTVPGTSAAAVAAPGTPGAAPAGQPGGAVAPAQAAVAPAGTPGAAVAPPAGEPAAATAQTAPPAASTAPAYAPLKRDPMISPFDHVRMMEEEEAKRLARERLEAEKNRKSRPVVKRVVDPRTLVELQGIISTPEGESKAIVNNEVVGAGESVGKGIKILRITNAGVTFEYQGKRFTKSVNRE